MKIAILSPERSGYAQKRLTEEIERKGHEAVIISPMSLFAFISSKINDDKLLKPKMGSDSNIDIGSISAIIPRIAGVRYFDYGCMIVQHFNENLNIFSTATEFGMRICSNKFKNAQFLSRYGIRVPKQVLSHCPNNYKDILALAGGLPAVGKLQTGSCGAGVFWMNDELAATTSLKSFEKTGTDVIVQNFIDTGMYKERY